MKKRIELTDYPELLETVSRELEAGNAVEIRQEQDSLVLVRLGRSVRLKLGVRPE